MGVKNLDFKQIAMNYGEKIGLGVGAGLMLLLVFWGVTSGTSTPTSKEEIAENGTKAQSAIQSRAVEEEKLKPKDVPSKPELERRTVEFNKPIPEGAVPLPSPFYARTPFDDTYRTNPDVLAPIEIVGRAVPIAVRIKQIDVKNETAVIIDAERTIGIGRVQSKKKTQEAIKQFRNFGAAGGEGAPGMGMAGMGGMGMMGMGGMGGMGGPMMGKGKFGQKPFKPEEKPKDEPPIEGSLDIVTHANVKPIKQVKPDDVIAETLAPARTVLVVGSFPHRKQQQEIARALKIDESEVPLLYRRLEAQRREIVPKNAPLPNGGRAKEDLVKVGPNRYEPLDPDKGWATLDFSKGPIQWLFSLTVEFEDELDPMLKALEVGRLVMDLPKPQRGKYPDLASELKSVQEAKDNLEKDAQKNAPPPREHPGLPKQIDPFNREGRIRGSEGSGAKPGATAKPPGGGGLAPIQAGSGGGRPGTDDALPPATGGREGSYGPPTNCLIRFLDYDPNVLRPGATYEYRVRVVLHNPNYRQHAQVQDQRFAEVEELKGAWSTPNLRVTLPEENLVFADVREVKGIDRETHKAAIQLHKWLQGVRTQTDFHPVGEWWVEKLLVARGEYIGRVNETRYIVWVSTGIDPATNKIGLDVFKHVKNDPENLWTGALLVDFESYARPGIPGGIPGGGKVTHQYPGKPGFTEDTPTEILFVDEQGRLMARHQHADAADPDRSERSSRWERWVQSVKESLQGVRRETSGGNKPTFDK